MIGTFLYFLLLLYCVTVQYNDVDAVGWMLFYGIAATSVIPFMFGTPMRLLALSGVCIGGISSLLWGVLCWPLNEEELREIGGFLVITIGHFRLYLKSN